MTLRPAAKDLFFSKDDPSDPRLGEWFQSSTLEQVFKNQVDLALIGYPDDEGISLNGGRIGAKEAPEYIRKYLYKMTPDVGWHHPQRPQLADIGNIDTQQSLELRHQEARQIINDLVKNQIPFISLGGGHDYGYSDTAGFLQATLQTQSSAKPLVLNFDAHLDVRPTDKGFNSGTPFYRVLNEFQGKFDFIEIGLQPQCNSRSHWDWAQDRGATLVLLETVEHRGLLNLVTEMIEPDSTRPVFISLDIDAFSSNEAPGCSQSWTTGLRVQDVLPVLSDLVKNFSVHGLGLYEVSPPLDQDHRTSKLAALIAHHFLFQTLHRRSV